MNTSAISAISHHQWFWGPLWQAVNQGWLLTIHITNITKITLITSVFCRQWIKDGIYFAHYQHYQDYLDYQCFLQAVNQGWHWLCTLPSFPRLPWLPVFLAGSEARMALTLHITIISKITLITSVFWQAVKQGWHWLCTLPSFPRLPWLPVFLADSESRMTIHITNISFIARSSRCFFEEKTLWLPRLPLLPWLLVFAREFFLKCLDYHITSITRLLFSQNPGFCAPGLATTEKLKMPETQRARN